MTLIDRYSLTCLVAAAGAPVTVAECRAHCHVDLPDEDALILRWINTATKHIERIESTRLITSTWTLSLDLWPASTADNKFASVEFPIWPIQSVGEVRYIDVSGAQQVWDEDNYSFTTGKPARLTPAYGVIYPTLQIVPGAVEIDLVAGYGGPDAVPEDIKQAIYLMVGHFFRNREAATEGSELKEIPLGVESLLAGSSLGSML
jgi:uncharacterized phiE125 gp8 family phage protein